MQTEVCSRGCGRETVPKNTYSRPICGTCQTEIDSGKVVWRGGILVDLPDELRRYDKYGDVLVAVYFYKGRPHHTDPADAPEVTWEQFVKNLLHNRDFPGSWHLWAFRRPDEAGNGAELCMDASYTASADHAYVRIKGGLLR